MQQGARKRQSDALPHCAGQFLRRFARTVGKVREGLCPMRHCRGGTFGRRAFPPYVQDAGRTAPAPAGKHASLPYGSGHARLPIGKLRAGHRYVRLRFAHSHCPKRHGAYLQRQGGGAQRRVQKRFFAAGRKLRLLLLQKLFQSVSAAPCKLRRNSGSGAAQHTQRKLFAATG